MRVRGPGRAGVSLCSAHPPRPAGAEVHVCNQQRFGYINVPVKAHQTLEDERVNFVHLTLEAMGELQGVPVPFLLVTEGCRLHGRDFPSLCSGWSPHAALPAHLCPAQTTHQIGL